MLTNDDILKELTIRHAVTEELLLTLIAGLPESQDTGFIEALTGYLTATYSFAEKSARTAPERVFAHAARAHAEQLATRLRGAPDDADARH